MNIANKIKLIWLYFKGDISAHNKEMIEQALANPASVAYTLDMGAVLVTNRRRFADEPIRGVIRNHPNFSDDKHRLGIALTMSGAKEFEGKCEQCRMICKFINEFNMVQKEKYVGNDTEVGRNHHLRPRGRADNSKSSSDKR